MRTRIMLGALLAILDALALGKLLTRSASPDLAPALAATLPAQPQPRSAAAAHPPAASETATHIPENAFVLRFQRARRDPAFMASLDSVRRRTTERTYGPLCQRLRLDSPARDGFIALLLDKQLEKSDAEASGSHDMMRAIVAAQADTNRRIQDLLGATGYQTYLEFEATTGLRATVDRFATLAAAAGEPLVAAARERAAQALATAMPGGETVSIAGVTGLSAEVAAGLVTPPFNTPLPPDAPARLAGLLSASQQAALADLMLRQEDELALRAAVLAPQR